MFADPQQITINAVDYDLVKINQDAYSSEYLLRSTDDEYRLRIRNTTYRPRGSAVTFDRHNVELVRTVFAVAPSTQSVIRKAYFVFEIQQGDSLSGCVLTVGGLVDWLKESSFANLTKLCNFES